MSKKLLEVLDKEIALKSAEAAVIEELLASAIAPKYRKTDDGDVVGMELAVSTTQDALSIICAFNQYGSNRIVQTMPGNDGYRASAIRLSDRDMDKIVALWIRYKIEMLRQG